MGRVERGEGGGSYLCVIGAFLVRSVHDDGLPRPDDVSTKGNFSDFLLGHEHEPLAGVHDEDVDEAGVVGDADGRLVPRRRRSLDLDRLKAQGEEPGAPKVAAPVDQAHAPVRHGLVVHVVPYVRHRVCAPRGRGMRERESASGGRGPVRGDGERT